MTIDDILSAKSWGSFDLPKTKDSLRFLQMQFHPDINKDPRAHDAFVKINELFNSPDYDLRVVSGERYGDHKITWTPKRDFNDRLHAAEFAMTRLSSLKDPFKMFFPRKIDSSPNALRIDYDKGWYFLSDYDVPFDSRTLVWMAKRLAGALNQSNKLGFAHCNIHPSTVVIKPSDHGIMVDGWWHSVSHGSRLVLKPDTKTPIKYLNGYKADNKIDIAQAAAMLLSVGKPDKLIADVLQRYAINPGTPVDFFNDIDDTARKLYGKNSWHPLGLPKTQMI